MGRKLNRTIYKSKRAEKYILRELMESFLYLLYLSTPPYLTKVFSSCFGDNIQQSSINVQVSRLYKKGYISKIRKGRNVFVSLSTNFWKIKGDYIHLKREKYNKRWDKKWRVLIYDVPESKKGKRERLRSFIRQLGFVRLQDSCWVSCYDYSKVLYQFLKEEKILDYACIYEGTFYTGKNIDTLVKDTWNLDDLFKNYRQLINSCKNAIEFIKTKEVGLKEYYCVYHKIYRRYMDILQKDPFLPKEFAKDSLCTKAEKLFNNLCLLVAKEIKINM